MKPDPVLEKNLRAIADEYAAGKLLPSEVVERLNEVRAAARAYLRVFPEPRRCPSCHEPMYAHHMCD